MVRRVLFSLIFFVTSYSSFYGQPTRVITTAELNTKSLEIRQERPEISAIVLNQDTAKIRSNFPTIEERFNELGFSREETVEAILFGWEKVRLDSPLQASRSINSASFVEFMTVEFLAENGKVKFTSVPDEAELTVNGENLGKTATSRWYSVGRELEVTCKKEGFQTTVITCPVAAGRNDCPCKMPAEPN